MFSIVLTPRPENIRTGGGIHVSKIGYQSINARPPEPDLAAGYHEVSVLKLAAALPMRGRRLTGQVDVSALKRARKRFSALAALQGVK
jgi:hypothetical protein